MEKKEALEIIVKIVNGAVAAGLFKSTFDVVSAHEAISVLVKEVGENKDQANV